MRAYEIIIYDGSHYCDAIKSRYITIGSMDQMHEGARVKVKQLRGTARTWVDVIDPDNNPVTHWDFN